MENRVIIATVISALIIILWWTVFAPPVKNIPVRPPSAQVTPVVEKGGNVTARTGYREAAKEPGLPVPSAVQKGREYVVENSASKIVINSYGAGFIHYYIKEGANPMKWPDLVLDNGGSGFSTFPQLDFSLVSRRVAGGSAAAGGTEVLEFHAAAPGAVDLYKTYEFAQDGGLNKAVFRLVSARDTRFPLEIAWGPGVGSGSAKEDGRDQACKLLRKVNGKFRVTKQKSGAGYSGEYTWAGMENRYYAAIFVNTDKFGLSLSKKDKPGFSTIILAKEVELAANKPVTVELPFYAGPKREETLKSAGYELGRFIQFGTFSPVGKFFLSCLRLFHKWTKNYGVAIIFLTFLIQVVTLPLTLKSFESSKAMKMIQPKMKEIQDKFKSDPQRLNTEIMHLYKSHKVNPLGGCLPMLLQLPIFWALFTTLRSAYQLRNAPFLFWIKDLSAPDMLATVGGVPIRVLPVLMGLSMFLQQKLSGVGNDPTQKTMLYVMPVMFTVIFLNFPSGLVLYWFVNNLLVTAAQYVILKRTPVEPAGVTA
jgi:YidC/Oxa1 family membrane protein insertase